MQNLVGNAGYGPEWLKCAPEHVFILADILVLVGGAILPAPAVTASIRIFTRLKRVLGHGSAVDMRARGGACAGRARGGAYSFVRHVAGPSRHVGVARRG